jgi:hypothetical protein
MTQTLLAAIKRLHIVRNLLLLALALVLLLVGFVFRGFVPANWVQPFRIGSITPPNGVVQAPMSVATSTNEASVKTGMNGNNDSDTTLDLSATPTPTISTATSTGIITVITLTPTAANVIENTVPIPTQSGGLPEQKQEPLPSAIAPMTANSTSSQLSPAILRIQTDIAELSQIVGVTRTMLQTFSYGKMTTEELIALQAQLTVMALRIEKLTLQLEAAQADLDTFGTNARISPGQVRDLLDLIGQSVGLVQSMLSNPAIDGATLSQAETFLEQIQKIMEQVQSLIAPNSFVNVPATPTLIPTATLVPTAAPTALTTVNDQMIQLQAMLRQMGEIMRQMQSMLEKIQAQPGTGVISPTP